MSVKPLNSLAPGRFEWNLRHVIFKWILVTGGWGMSCEIALIWMSLDVFDDQSTLVQVMAWCRQAVSHYLSQCWPRSLSLYGVITAAGIDTEIIPEKIFQPQVSWCNFALCHFRHVISAYDIYYTRKTGKDFHCLRYFNMEISRKMQT